MDGETYYSSTTIQHDVPTFTLPGTKTMEFVGRQQVVDRLPFFSQLGQMDLSDCRIGNELGKDLPIFNKLESLSLEKNLLTCWGTVRRILKRCPKLSFLSLASNGMADEELQRPPSSSEPPISVVDTRTHTSTSLRTLVLNRTRVTWSSVPWRMFPELHGKLSWEIFRRRLRGRFSRRPPIVCSSSAQELLIEGPHRWRQLVERNLLCKQIVPIERTDHVVHQPRARIITVQNRGVD